MSNDVNKYVNKDPKSHSLNNKVSPKRSPSNNQFIDNRPEAALQRKYQEMANNSPQAARMAQLQSMADNHAAKQAIQKADTNTHNNTGLPDHLKSGMESLSGINLNHVKVHYNSAKPAAVQAHAYAQGHDIHLSAGQEKHLPHELGHVIQQAQGRVNPTTTIGGLAINDNAELEKEADVLGAKALQMQPKENNSWPVAQKKSYSEQGSMFVGNGSKAVTQRELLRDSCVSQFQLASVASGAVNSFNIYQPMQFIAETLEQKIIRILAARKIVITADEAVGYATFLTEEDENTEIQVVGHNRALKLNKAGIVSSIVRRPQSDASRMRVSAVSGPMQEDASSMVTEGPRPLTGERTSQGATISAATLSDIPSRSSLRSVMGGSAAKMSGIEHSEWLHIVAHSLGGPDSPVNIVAGSHSLNTAMIPFERFVRASARSGHMTDYSVTFYSDTEQSVMYVHHVEIRIVLPEKSGIWTLQVNRESMSEFINGQVLADIEEFVAAFAAK
ncbi:eCIS core domain-containing protein [Shewanella surugensis]|uniref:DUF4157 domain-containing protein n=1 Tax=Shewanella surugensis TaxID=212020 RepID=A0ABT0L9Z6_9GAMM|nr:DUF4157 domain-containing protein [Shewanella surugensis]MCL1124305.1 DUF4157 domain-containing protein [Shewanella surugensis]